LYKNINVASTENPIIAFFLVDLDFVFLKARKKNKAMKPITDTNDRKKFIIYPF